MRRQALREHNVERVSKRVKREKNSFLKDHPFEARRSDVLLLFEDICTVLKETSESDEIRFEIARLRREFKIDEDVTELVDEYEKFKQRLEHLTYVGVLSAQEKPLGNDGNDRDRDEGESKTAAEPVATTKSKAET
jgi:hypothetical protein